MERYDIERSLARLLDSSKSAPDDFIGTAFFIDPFHLLTAEHCIRPHTNNTNLNIDSFEGHGNHRVTIVDFDAELDVALLKVTGSSFKHAAQWIPVPASDHDHQDGTELTVYGFSKDTPQLDPRKRTVLNYDDTYDILRLDDSIAKGMSGSPVLDEVGLVGLEIERNPDSACHNVRPINSFAPWVDQKIAPSRRTTLPRWFSRYFSTLRRTVEDLPSDQMLTRLAGNDQDLRVNTRDVYVPLHVPNQNSHREQTEPAQQNMTDQRPTPLIEAVEKNKLIVVIGDPGSGKSTFLRYLTARLIGHLEGEESEGLKHEETLPAGLSYHVPLFIELKDLYWRFLSADGEQLDKAPTAHAIATAIEDYLGSYFRDLKDKQQRDNFLWGSEASPFKPMWLLDGLDELNLSDACRTHFINGLTAWSLTLPEDDHRVCLTTRPYAYQGRHIRSFNSTKLERLADEGIEAFINRFFQITGPRLRQELDQDALKQQATTLINILSDESRLALKEIVANPLLLTLTTALFCKHGEEALPRDRAELYDKCLSELLERWKQKSSTGNGERSLHQMMASEHSMTKALNHLGFYAHMGLTEANEEERDNGDISQALLKEAFEDHLNEDYNADHVIDYLQNKTGLTNDRDGGRYGFIHRSFREYLAARYIAANDSINILNSLRDACVKDPGWWREVLALAARIGDAHPNSLRPTVLLSHLLFYDAQDMPTEDWLENPWIFAEAIANAESERDKPDLYDWDRKLLRRRCVNWLSTLVEKNHLGESPEFRNQAGITLSRLGDPRKGVGLMNDKDYLPDIDWIEISPGNISLRNDAGDFEIEQPFLMSRYPVTNAQFEAFVKDTNGYSNTQWWTAIEDQQKAPSPSRWNESNHPKTNVSWYEAVAFCRWLTHRLQQHRLIEPTHKIRLPTEIEWQLAATGGSPENTYPWGKKYRSGAANINETNADEQVGSHTLGRTSTVGLYHFGHSVDGLFDMSGNVSEWCLNDYFEPRETSINTSVSWRSMRGGAWNDQASYARCSCRDHGPDGRSGDLGFRLLCSAPPLGTDH